VRGVPVWAKLIALVDDGQPVLGLVAAPALGRRWWAANGSGAWSGRSLSSAKRIGVSKVSRIPDASLSYSSLGGWKQHDRYHEFLALADEAGVGVIDGTHYGTEKPTQIAMVEWFRAAGVEAEFLADGPK